MTYFWFGLFLVALTLGFASAPRDQTGHRPLITAHGTILMLFVIYVGMPSVLLFLNRGQYLWAVQYGTPGALSDTVRTCLFALCIYLVAHHFIAVRGENSAEPLVSPPELAPAPLTGEIAPSSRLVGHIAVFLLVVGLGLKIYLLITSGGLEASAIRQSAGARSTSGVGQLNSGQISLRTLSGIADAASVWLLLSAMKQQKRLVLPGTIFAVTVTLSYLSIGKRLALLLPIVAIAIGYHKYRQPLRLSKAPIALVTIVGIGMLSLFFRIFVPASLTGSHIDLEQLPYARGSVIRFYFYSLEFSSVEMITVATAATPPVSSLLGGDARGLFVTNIEPFAYVVPRAIWPGKPTTFTDVSYAIASTVNGTPLAGTVGYASTIIGTSWVFGGPVGLIIFMIGLAFYCALADRCLRTKDWTITRVVTYAILVNIAFHWFRQGTLGWVFVIGVVQQLGFLTGFALLAGANRRGNHRLTTTSLDRPRELVSRPVNACANKIGAMKGAPS